MRVALRALAGLLALGVAALVALVASVPETPVPERAELRIAHATVVEPGPVAVGDLCRRFADEGVWVRPMGKVVYLTPALTIDANDLDALCAAVFKALDRVAAEGGRR